MSRIKRHLPRGLVWQLSFLNIIVIIATIGVSGWAIYNTACFLAGGIGEFSAERQHQFNRGLLRYLIIFSTAGVMIGGVLHYFLIKRMLKPIHHLIKSTKLLKQGEFPEPLRQMKHDEVGELTEQFNELIAQLQINEAQRIKLITDLSHEFRTPLANLTGYLKALQLGDIKGSEALYESLTNEAKRLRKMVEQLEQLKEWDHIASQTYVNKQLIDISEEIIQCTEMFNWTVQSSEIKIHAYLESCDVRIHNEGIQQVMGNLLDNAIFYYEGCGAIEVKGEKSNDHYVVTVSGPSEVIEDEHQDKIFERFYRVDSARSRSRGGSGLGLAICKEIIEQHHGKIGVYREAGLNHFWFTIPLE